MEFDNSFDVPLPPAEAWLVLMDIERIAPCMPGAELTEVVDANTYKGKISVRLGPVALTFAGVVEFEERDNTNHMARVKAQGTDAKGRGGANAIASFKLEPAAAGSKVLVHTNLTLSGSVAQYGRGVGMIQATASAIMKQFADSLKKELARSEAAPAAAPVPPPAPASTAASAPVAPAAASAAPHPPPTRPPPTPAKPISGFSLMASVIWDSIVRLFTGRPK
jgi:carbon monoxide dehydrogenase subunit G